MNHSLEESPLTQTTLTGEKMAKWIDTQSKGEKNDVDVYGKPSEKQLKELENIRSLSRELQENLHDLENSVRIADVENQAMHPTAPVLDYSEDHEFVSANQLDNYYAEEDRVDAKEEEKRRLTKGIAPKTEIQDFYKDQCVFVTGGTGFLGKVLLEKLLRSCTDVDTIYVLIRNKKGMDAKIRLHEMFNEFVFNRAHKENPKGIHKVVPIVGDMTAPGLGISDEDRKLLTSRVTVIINGAATVKFDEKLSIATTINVKGPKEVIRLARECRNLRAITHISTAYSNANHKYIEERFYDPPITVEALEAISDMDEQLLESITPVILGEYPNTYCFTKCVAEEAVRKYGEGMPICIIRPSMVMSTYEEPVRGWTDSFYGPTGIIVGIGTGMVHTMCAEINKVADMVPVDLTANAILASAWYTAKHFKENQTSHIPIYNFVSGAQNPVTWGGFLDLNYKLSFGNPTIKSVWYYGLTTTNIYGLFLIYNFFLHYLPAFLADAFSTLRGKDRKMLKIYHRMMKLCNVLLYFSMREWRFCDQNVCDMWRTMTAADRAVYPLSMAEMSWDYYCETFMLGLRVYLMKDDLSTMPEAKKRWNRLYYLHQLTKLIVLGLAVLLVYVLSRSIFKF